MGIRTEKHEIDGVPVATVWLDRPERMNALSADMWDGLKTAFAELREERKARLVYLRSNCEKAFCTGLDLAGGGGTPGAGGFRALVRTYQKTFDAIEDHPAPVVAVLHGYTFGGGMELAMSCDLRIAADDTVMGLTEARVGLIPGAGGTQRLPKYVGLGRAKYLILTGERIDAQKALSWGLLDEVHPRAEIEKGVADLTQRLLRCAPLSQEHAKRLVRRSFQLDRDAGGEAETDAAQALVQTRDMVEGMRAFVEKRAPKWQGR